ncbi:MAG TPA: hypothetical protein VGV37_29865 [Aliidongia sp.]|uniref:hypothetical protein n=1 Tax=Aliidongia sp. TaxID=1914230 RepID=UPI002DDCFEA2|nr:hypothetical protein [Aliidongia sp.]HEV2678772.1 hypothetical protein [Aliidongia sp.]
MASDGTVQPLYLDGPNGALFAVWHRPAGSASDTVLYLPPFAEEMNRSRRTIALLGRAMTARGLGLFVLDPFGTGDSAGGFEEASWTGWLADAQAAVRFITAEGHRVAGTMGLRTGALLALATARTERLERAVLCQPVESGLAFVTGLMRSRIAGAQAGDGPRVTTAGLRETLATGSCIEIMGYQLSPALCAGLEAATLVEAGSGFAGRIDWLQLTSRPTGPLPQKTADEVARLAAVAAGTVASQAVEAPSFWLLEEPPPADRFVLETTDVWFSAGPATAA